MIESGSAGLDGTPAAIIFEPAAVIGTPVPSKAATPVGAGVAGEVVSGMDDDIDLDTIEVKEGESLEDIKAKLKPNHYLDPDMPRAQHEP